MSAQSDPQPEPNSTTNQIITAIRFLTIVPLPGATNNADFSLAKAATFFPLVGLLLGLLLALLGLMVGWIWNSNVRAVAVVIASGILTSGLHLDGLSDTFDGVMSWRPRERKLEIMRDSRIGVMGALALFAVLALKVVLLSSSANWLTALLLAPVLGRWAMVYALVRFPAARTSGLGATAQSQSDSNVLLEATLIALMAALLIAGLAGGLAYTLVWLAIHILARWWTRALGGLTGDTYGALCEISEVVALAVLTAHISIGS